MSDSASSAMWDELDSITLENVTPGLSGEAGVYHGEDQIASTSTLPGYEQPAQEEPSVVGGSLGNIGQTFVEVGRPDGNNVTDDGSSAYDRLMGMTVGGAAAASGSGYGYGRSYSYGSSGNYSPKIYSNSRSLNASRPSTMYSKQPRDANYSYLRPSFTTQGSRSAYER